MPLAVVAEERLRAHVVRAIARAARGDVVRRSRRLAADDVAVVGRIAVVVVRVVVAVATA
jgi:hypothetical protein